MRMQYVGMIGCLLLAACGSGTTMAMKRSASVPAAQARLQIQKEENNTRLKISAAHLAPAPRVAPGANEYVVWIRPLDGASGPRNAGAMTVDEDLESSLTTVTPHEDFEVFLTPEPSGNVTVPSGPKVLWAQVR